ncbi:MAG TPA: hypothetical protein VEZ26_09555 [Sphingomonadaceae bacterium]|nr:hypothetical protein [Sphingomonadaceae bacterium]
MTDVSTRPGISTSARPVARVFGKSSAISTSNLAALNASAGEPGSGASAAAWRD